MLQLKTRLKISSVTTLTDGRYFAAVGAEWIGFNIDEGKERYVNTELANEIMGWLSGPRFVGQFEELEESIINKETEVLKLDIIQTKKELDLNVLTEKVQSIIQEIDVLPTDDFDEIRSKIEAQKHWTSQFLLNIHIPWNTIKNNNGWTVEQLKTLCEIHPIFLKMDFTPSNLLEIIEQVEPFGVDFNGGNEIKTGIQVFDEIQELIELLEID